MKKILIATALLAIISHIELNASENVTPPATLAKNARNVGIGEATFKKALNALNFNAAQGWIDLFKRNNWMKQANKMQTELNAAYGVQAGPVVKGKTPKELELERLALEEEIKRLGDIEYPEPKEKTPEELEKLVKGEPESKELTDLRRDFSQTLVTRDFVKAQEFIDSFRKEDESQADADAMQKQLDEAKAVASLPTVPGGAPLPPVIDPEYVDAKSQLEDLELELQNLNDILKDLDNEGQKEIDADKAETAKLDAAIKAKEQELNQLDKDIQSKLDTLQQKAGLDAEKRLEAEVDEAQYVVNEMNTYVKNEVMKNGSFIVAGLQDALGSIVENEITNKEDLKKLYFDGVALFGQTKKFDASSDVSNSNIRVIQDAVKYINDNQVFFKSKIDQVFIDNKLTADAADKLNSWKQSLYSYYLSVKNRNSDELKSLQTLKANNLPEAAQALYDRHLKNQLQGINDPILFQHLYQVFVTPLEKQTLDKVVDAASFSHSIMFNIFSDKQLNELFRDENIRNKAKNDLKKYIQTKVKSN